MSFAPLTPPEASARSIDDLLRDVKSGKVRLPQFQRSFRWEQKHIRDLFDSIYRGYPIGSLLFWDTDQHAEGTAALFGSVSFPSSPRGGHLLVVDGQQRLTAMVATLLRDREPEAPGEEDFYLFFDLDSSTFMIPTPKQGPNPAWLPLNKIADTLQYLEWLEELPPGPEREPRVQAANLVVRAIRDYKVPVYIVHSDDEGALRTIFERLNTSGKPLKSSEVFRAIKGKRGDFEALQERLDRLGFGGFDEDLVRKCTYAILGLQRDNWEQLRARGSGDVLQAMTDAALAIGRVVQFLRDDAGVARLELLPYREPIIVLAKLFHDVPKPSDDSRARLRKWLWRGTCTGRHEMNDSQLRATLALISADEHGSIAGLEAQLRGARWVELSLPRHDFRSAPTKLLANVLVSQRPLHLETGAPLLVGDLLDKLGAKAFEHIIPRRRIKGDPGFEKTAFFNGTANRVLHSHLHEGSVLEALLRVPETRKDIMKSHVIDARAEEALRAGRYDEFLRLRHATLKKRARFYYRVLGSWNKPERDRIIF